MASRDAEIALMQPVGWGSIEEVVNAPLIDVTGANSWCSVLGMWVFLLPNLILGVIGGCCACVFKMYAVGCCYLFRCWSAYGSVQAGLPLCTAPIWWVYMITGLVALAKNSKSRLGLFLWEWAAFGSGRYFWHGEGIWSALYEDCDNILRSDQRRKSAFGCIQACIPDLFATNILIFLSNDGPESEWAAIRQTIHRNFTDTGSATYKERMGKLSTYLKGEWPNPTIDDFNDTAKIQKLVAKSIFYMMFGNWITEAEATTLIGWRTNAMFFILPRLIQRFLFNLGINKVKQLRIDTVKIVEAYNLQDTFMAMNNDLPARFRRTQAVKLADEILYVVGFAGIGGTSGCVESVGQFLQVKKPAEAPGDKINFGEYKTTQDMVAAYKANPDSYIRETCRLDPPVTSATNVLKAALQADLGGNLYDCPENTLNQYVISLANRDPKVFPEPELFNPKRANVTKALTWNGAFGEKDDDKNYPRICPGRYLAMDIAKKIIGMPLAIAS